MILCTITVDHYCVCFPPHPPNCISVHVQSLFFQNVLTITVKYSFVVEDQATKPPFSFFFKSHVLLAFMSMCMQFFGTLSQVLTQNIFQMYDSIYNCTKDNVSAFHSWSSLTFNGSPHSII